MIPGLTQWVKDLVLLWLWCRPAATAPIRPLAWELSYASSAALKRQRKGFDFLFFRAAPEAYGGFQARVLIRAVAAGLCHSHSSARSKPHL